MSEVSSPGNVGSSAGSVIKAVEARVRHPEDGDSGPMTFDLKPGEGALVAGLSLPLLRGLMEICLGSRRPDEGAISWNIGRGGPRPGDLWSGYDFYRQIGYVNRHSQLLSNISLLENLILLYSYGRLERPEAVARARGILEIFGLSEYEESAADALPEPERRLALYALSFCKRPRLFLMERPAQFLDRDFDKIWDIV
ncbi:MAG: hypothetical protein LBS31_02840, partial [Candidatus Adiutrix sp.]|nr:hypothetical protein [Candidatus Adiutrix sp.]